ncbi:MAG: hypothetical protein P1V20_18820 [Verrucomicrobiales bacterium]|nr:hypothetical protein [Verrucomicrobiales bacterium]
MTRETEQALLNFCVRQRDQFEAAEWLKVPHPERDEFLAAVLFLAGVDWYGYRNELVNIATQIEPESIGHLSKVVGRTGFDLSRFSNSLRQQLKHESVVRAS